MSEQQEIIEKNIEYSDKKLLAYYRQNLIIEYMALMGYDMEHYGINASLAIDKVLTFRKNPHLQAKMLNEIFYLSAYLDDWDSLYYYEKLNM